MRARPTLVPDADRIATEMIPTALAGYKFAPGDIETACDMRTHGKLGIWDLGMLTKMVERRIGKALYAQLRNRPQ
jgi:hypothetical protein